MLFMKKSPSRNNDTRNELSDAIKIAIGYRSISQFISILKMVDPKPIIELLEGKNKELPNRQLLRKIAGASEGRIGFNYLYDLCGYSTRDKEEDRTWAKWVPNRGDVVMCDLGMYGQDSEQQGQRPFLVISNNKGNTHGSIIVGCPLTRKFKNPLLHVPVGTEYGLREPSFVMVEHIRSISKRRCFYNGGIPHKITTLPDSLMEKIQHALEFELGFQPLMFNENEAFRMIEHIKNLERNIKVKKSHDLIQLMNEKLTELINYCSKYHVDHKRMLNEYDRISNYAYQAI